jgi:hypothetical protein
VKPGTVVPAFLDAHRWSGCFGVSFLELMLYDLAHRQRILGGSGTYLRKVTGAGGLPDGRNEAVCNFLDATDAEWLWFVDTDMGFAPDTVDRLVAAADPKDRPVVGGLCFALRRTGKGPLNGERFGVIPTVYSYAETGDEVGFLPLSDYPRDQLVQVAGTGAACLLIHRSALVALRERYGDAWFDTTKHPTGLQGRPRSFSEDLSFCVRLAACGVPLHVDTGVKTTHEKGGIFLDEEIYTRQQVAANSGE